MTKADNLVLYERFLAQNRGSKYSAQAEARLAELRWKQATTLDSIDGFARYVDDDPRAPQAAAAKSRLLALLEEEFEQVRSTVTIAAYDAWLEKRPRSPHAPQATATLDRLMWEAARAGNLSRDYRRYLGRFPLPRHAKEACEVIARRNAEGLTAIDWAKGYAPEACTWTCQGATCRDDLDATLLRSIATEISKLERSPGSSKSIVVGDDAVCQSTLTRGSETLLKAACGQRASGNQVSLERRSGRTESYATNFIDPSAATRWKRGCDAAAK